MSGLSLSVGIVGLPNVGKSTLFNALLKKQQALVANYPFATIEPNIGIVSVPDERLIKLAKITKDEEKMAEFPPIKPATVKFIDIAGLVKGASIGAGLGNKFLSHIREVSVVAHVIRAFNDENIIKEGAVDPKSDYETINTELILADIQSIKNQELKIKDQASLKLFAHIKEQLNNGVAVRDMIFTSEEKQFVGTLSLLTMKPEIIVLNVSENDYTKDKIQELIKKYEEIFRLALFAQDDRFVVICAKIESELAELKEDEQKQYLADLGLQISGLSRLIQKAYTMLGLISFLTCGEKEVKAWTIVHGSNAQMAAGEIHTDFIKKFIKAEVVSLADFVENHGWKSSREKGKARLEGKEYLMQDGDVVEFKIGS